jgi:hypothetical protein
MYFRKYFCKNVPEQSCVNIYLGQEIRFRLRTVLKVGSGSGQKPFGSARLLTSMDEIRECDHVQDVAVVAGAAVVGSAGHHDQACEEEGQGGGEGVAQLTVDQQATEAWLLLLLTPSCSPTALAQLVQVQQLPAVEQLVNN